MLARQVLYQLHYEFILRTYDSGGGNLTCYIYFLKKTGKYKNTENEHFKKLRVGIFQRDAEFGDMTLQFLVRHNLQ